MYMALQTTGGRTTTWHKGEKAGQLVKNETTVLMGGSTMGRGHETHAG